MSKVKIQGNASGTGVLTVTAPNTSTDRTITLPDATGTLLNSDGSGANLTSLPNGSQLDHSGTKKIEASSDGALITGEVNSNGGGFRVKSGSSTLGGIFKSGYIAGDGTSDVTVFSETGKKIHFCANGSATKVLSVSNHGLLFNGDTAAANALHDYEEGTWTPSYSSNIAFSTQMNFSYVKIGSIVKITGYCNGASGTFGTTWSVSGLPYTSNNNYNVAPLWSHGQDQDYMMYMESGSSVMNIRDRDGASMNGMSEIAFDCVYITSQ